MAAKVAQAMSILNMNNHAVPEHFSSEIYNYGTITINVSSLLSKLTKKNGITLNGSHMKQPIYTHHSTTT